MESPTMFKGMQDVLNKWRKKSTDTTPEDTGVIPIVSAENLLANEKRTKLLAELQKTINIPDADYQRIFLNVVDNFAEFVQELPETQNSYFSQSGGILEHALERALLSLVMCRTYLLPAETSLASLTPYEMLWVYAVFTASLFLDIGKMVTKLMVTLIDQRNEPIKMWLAYTGSMVGQGTSYKFEFLAENRDRLSQLVTPLIARQILPADINLDDETEQGSNTGPLSMPGGFAWIASDNDVLEAWLAMLSGDTRQMGSLLSIIPVIEAQIMRGYFIEGKKLNYALDPRTLAFLERLKERKLGLNAAKKETAKKGQKFEAKTELGPEAKADTSGYISEPSKVEIAGVIGLAATDKAIKMSQEFVAWLEQGIKDGKISYNEANSFIQVISEKEAVILPKAIEEFAQFKNMDAKAVLQQLNNASGIIDFNNLPMLLAQSGEAFNALMRINPYLIFPPGVGLPALTTTVFPIGGAYTAVVLDALNVLKPIEQIQKPNDADEQKQQQQQQQQQIQNRYSVIGSPTTRR